MLPNGLGLLGPDGVGLGLFAPAPDGLGLRGPDIAGLGLLGPELVGLGLLKPRSSALPASAWFIDSGLAGIDPGLDTSGLAGEPISPLPP